MDRNETGGSVQAEALRRADRALVGGGLGSFRVPPDVAMVIARGNGSRLWDLDGREYVDFLLGGGPLILGHSHPSVVKAVKEQVELGSQFYIVNEPVIRLAEEIIEAVPCAEKVRFTASGSEATFYTLRLARARTGRDKILKFEGGYHGHQDHTMMSVSSPSPGYPTGVPDSAGIPRSLVAETLVAPFNDIETTLAIMERHARDLAAVIVEPLQRVLSPKPGFLEALRTATRDLGIVLIFDELVTGFRFARGGAQEFYGVTPDLVALGKIIGGGYPLTAVAGKAEIMDLCDAKRKGSPDFVYFSGTLNGHPVSAAAGLATVLELRKPGSYERLNQAGARMRSALADVVAEQKISAQVIGDASLFDLAFTDRPIENYRDLQHADKKKSVRLGTELMRRGFFLNPGVRAYISLAHTDEEIDRFVAATADILHEMKKS